MAETNQVTEPQPDAWKLKESDAATNAMSVIARADDPDYIIGYVVTEGRNKAVRQQDLLHGRLLTASPALLPLARALIAREERPDSAETVRDLRKAAVLAKKVLSQVLLSE